MSSYKNLCHFFLSMGTALLITASALAEVGQGNINIKDSYYIFNPGNDFCALDETGHDVDKKLIDVTKKMVMAKNDLIGYYTLCDDIEKLRSGELTNPREWSIMNALKIRGQVQSMKGLDRPAYLKGLLSELSDGKDIDYNKDEIENRLSKLLAKSLGQKGSPINLGVQQLGVIDSDDNAVYLGLIINMTVAGEKKTNAIVIAMSIVRHYILSYNVYEEFKGSSTFDKLLKRSKKTMSQFVANNPDEREIRPSLKLKEKQAIKRKIAQAKIQKIIKESNEEYNLYKQRKKEKQIKFAAIGLAILLSIGGIVFYIRKRKRTK